MVNANTPILNLPIAIGLNGTEWIPLVQGGTTKRALSGSLVDAAMVQFPAAIEYVIGVRGGSIVSGRAGVLTVPFACTITSAELLTDLSGSVVIDVWRTSYANYPTVTSTFSITGGNPPTISGGVQYQDATLAGWTLGLSSGDILVYNVNSVSGITEVTLTLNVARSLI